jgi:excisionase family DNA binding protein
MTGRLLDKAELAELLGLPEGWVTKAVTARLIPHTRLGKHVRFSETDVAELIKSNHVPAETL